MGHSGTTWDILRRKTRKMIPLLRHEERVSHKGVQRGMVATQEDYREEAKFREVRLVILRATSRLRSFAVIFSEECNDRE